MAHFFTFTSEGTYKALTELVILSNTLWDAVERPDGLPKEETRKVAVVAEKVSDDLASQTRRPRLAWRSDVEWPREVVHLAVREETPTAVLSKLQQHQEST